MYFNYEKRNLRSSELCDGAGGFVRNNGKKTRGISIAKQPKTIARTTLGRVKRAIVRCTTK